MTTEAAINYTSLDNKAAPALEQNSPGEYEDEEQEGQE